MSSPRVVALALFFLLVAGGSAHASAAATLAPDHVGAHDGGGRSDANAVPAVASASGGTPTPRVNRRASCFPPGGHDIDIGTEGPRILVTVHTSLFTNLTRPGAFGVEAVGITGSVDVVTLRAGVLFDGVGPLGAFLAHPFSRFSTAFYYRFRLPVFAPYGYGIDYETDRSPVSGVNESAC